MLSAVSASRVDAAFEFLERRALDADSIDAACCAELKRVLTYRYESHFSSSTRLGGRGWGQGHIVSHMDRFLKNKLKNANIVLRASVCDDEALTDEYLDGLLLVEAGGEPDDGTAGGTGSAGAADGTDGTPAGRGGSAGSDDDDVIEMGSEAYSEAGSQAPSERSEARAAGGPVAAVRLASNLDDLDFG